MKNIHILPTDKPSRVYKNLTNDLGFVDVPYPNDGFCSNQNIYITSDEEIKEGDWALDLCEDLGLKYEAFKVDKATLKYANQECQKIILTDDEDLIKDGVQAIDDDFLEWFVKNPSCEEVKVRKNPKVHFIVKGKGVKGFNQGYKIIIPKEEVLLQSSIDGEAIWGESKQETLEEAIYRIKSENEHYIDEDAFELGAKWQQENSNINALDFEIKALKSIIQDMDATIKTKYSYEDMIKFISFVGKNYVKAKGFYYMKGDFEKSMKLSIHQILEQFKNK